MQKSSRINVYSDIKVRPQSYVQGVALVQMEEDGKIKFEVFPNKTKEQVNGFTSNALVYER